MPLPSKADLQTLDIAYLGEPFVQVEAKTLSTTSLDVAYLGEPFVVVGQGDLNVYAKISGVWKRATAMWVKASGAWKSVTLTAVNASGTWKF